jgi:hypothetical protein
MIKGPCKLCGDENYNLSMGGEDICPSCDATSNPYELIQILREENKELRRRISHLSDPNLRQFYEIHYGLKKEGGNPTILLDVPKGIYKSICEAVMCAKFDFYKSYQNGYLVDEWIRGEDERV